MFTGIVSSTGVVGRVGDRRGARTLEIQAEVARHLSVGDSIAVNGVCLTTTRASRRRFRADVVDETLTRTTMRGLSKGDEVNLELPARLSDRVGGHLVQGHVDGTAAVVRVEAEGDARRMWWDADDALLRYLVPKGSVAIDGVSLTVASVGTATFAIALVPHTLQTTTFGSLDVGNRTNVEVDVLAKYVEKLAGAYDGARERT